MPTIAPQLRRLARDDEGAAAVEYAILVAAISGVIFAMTFPYDLRNIFSNLGSHIQLLVTGL